MVFDMTEEDAKRSRDNAICTVQKIIDTKLVDEAEVVVRDTIANLMHWCDANGIDFEYELAAAHGFHACEKEDE